MSHEKPGLGGLVLGRVGFDLGKAANRDVLPRLKQHLPIPRNQTEAEFQLGHLKTWLKGPDHALVGLFTTPRRVTGRRVSKKEPI